MHRVQYIYFIEINRCNSTWTKNDNSSRGKWDNACSPYFVTCKSDFFFFFPPPRINMVPICHVSLETGINIPRSLEEQKKMSSRQDRSQVMNRIYSRRCETDGYVDTMNNYERRNISFSRLLTSISTIHRLTIPRIERSPPSIILGTRYSRYRFFFHNKSSIKKGGKFIYNLGLYIGNSQCSNNNLNRNLNRV